MNNVSVSMVDEEELDAELEELQQEQLDEAMLKTGTVPVSDAIHRMPAAAEGPRRRPIPTHSIRKLLTGNLVKGKQTAVEEDDEEAELRKLQAEMAM